VKTRTIEEIEQAFREMGLTESTWGRMHAPGVEIADESAPNEQVFIRIETTTTPVETKSDADLA